jgi:HSP20 family protein
MAENAVEKARREPAEWWPDFFGRWFDSSFPLREERMKVEEFVDGKELVIRAEMPGVDPEKDVDVHVRNHGLEIRAERKETQTTTDKGMRRSEFHYGSFYRRVPLPPDATEHDVHATYKDGVLEVRLPLDQKQSEATKIEVMRE